MSERIRRQETLQNHKEFVSTMTLDPPSTAFSVRRMSALPCRICSWEILQPNQNSFVSAFGDWQPSCIPDAVRL